MTSKRVGVRVSAAELRLWRRWAKLDGVTLSAWVRRNLDIAVQLRLRLRGQR
jgi:hypothetical protein